MEFHPYANLFPMMVGAARESFVEDIRKNGLLVPITTYDGKILDGRNRYSACVELGIEPRTDPYTGDDPLGRVMSLNRSRRQLKEAQRAMAAARLANLEHGTNRYGKKVDAQICASTFSVADAAEILRVAARTVTSARKLLREAPDEVIAAVDAGELSILAALKKIASKPQAELDKENSRAVQQAALAAGLSWAAKGDAISKAVRDAAGVKILSKVDMSDPAVRAKVDGVIAEFSRQSLEDQYAAHREEVKAMPETAKQKLERLVARELQLRNVMIDREVQELARQRMPDELRAMRESKERYDAEFKKHAAMRKGIPAQISEQDYRFLLNVLHPDRAPEDRRDKFARAFDIVRKLDEYIEAVKS